MSFARQSRGIMKQLPFDVPVFVIAAGKFRRYEHLSTLQHFTVPSVVFGNTRDSFRIIHGFFQSVSILLRNRPDIIFAKGGYVCLPMGLAAWLLRVPLVIHDSDTRPGLTNRVLSRFATKIATGYPLENYSYDPKKSLYTGVPIADRFVPVSISDQKKLKQKLGFDSEVPLIVATGGGLGSEVINTAVVRAMSELKHTANTYIIAGRKNYDTIQSQISNSATIKAIPFVYEGMADVLSAADVIVARGSATFLQELAGIGKPVIVVPAHQLGDQIKNAEVYKAAHAAIVLSDNELGEGKLTRAIDGLLADPSLSKKLAQNLHSLARPDAAYKVANLIVSVLRP